MKMCPTDMFLEYVSDKEVVLQKLAGGESIEDVIREFRNGGFKSRRAAKVAVLRLLAVEIHIVLDRIYRKERETYSVPILESLKKRNSRNYRSKGWWRRRRKDSVFVVVNKKRGAVHRDESWRLHHPGQRVRVQFPDGEIIWVAVSN